MAEREVVIASNVEWIADLLEIDHWPQPGQEAAAMEWSDQILRELEILNLAEARVAEGELATFQGWDGLRSQKDVTHRGPECEVVTWDCFDDTEWDSIWGTIWAVTDNQKAAALQEEARWILIDYDIQLPLSLRLMLQMVVKGEEEPGTAGWVIDYVRDYLEQEAGTPELQ